MKIIGSQGQGDGNYHAIGDHTAATLVIVKDILTAGSECMTKKCKLPFFEDHIRATSITILVSNGSGLDYSTGWRYGKENGQPHNYSGL